MTTPVENVTKTRKPSIKREFNDFGRFCAKVRIDMNMTSTEWAKALSVSSLTISNIERGDGKLSFDLALAIAKLIQEKAPEYEYEFASIVAQELNVLVIPAHTQPIDVQMAYNILVNGYFEPNAEGEVKQVVAE